MFTATDMPLDRAANDVAAADLNRDGKVDLVVAAAGGGDGETQFTDGFVYVLLGRGDGTFAQPVQYEVPPGPWQIVVGDFTRDGVLDVATANRSSSVVQAAAPRSNDSDTVSILAGNTDATFGAASSIALGDPGNPLDDRFRASVRSLTTTDVNGDAALTSWTLGQTAGTNNNVVTATGAGLATITFTASGIAGSARHESL